MEIEKKSTRKFLNAGIVVIVTVAFMLQGASISVNDNNNITMSLMSTMGDQWNVTLNFNESGGNIDRVVFGEAPDANDGPPADIYYDQPKIELPFPPYILAWFDDNLPAPCDKLLEDYRSYPDTEKVWNLSVKWIPSDMSSPTDITISWEVGDFDGCEYNSVVLYDVSGASVVADMLVYTEYTFTAVAMVQNDFRINAIMMPPEITNVVLMPSDPMDTEPGFGWENTTCTVTDAGFGVDIVKLVVTDPDSGTIEHPMNKDGDTYYYNTTLTIVGDYTYYIWANDMINNIATTMPETFTLYPNWDINSDGKILLADFILVAGHYGETGPLGWIREDANNNGKILLADFITIAGHYGEGG